jgi:hypothetical protein
MKPKKKQKETPEEFLERLDRQIEQLESEGSILASWSNSERILVVPFVTPAYGDYTSTVLRIFVSVLHKIKFTGCCHAFDQSLPQVSHDILGIAFAYEEDGASYDFFGAFWPILLAHFPSRSGVKILPEAGVFRSLGYVRRTMLCSGSVLFRNGMPDASLTKSSPFGMICYEERRRVDEECSSDDFFCDPLEPWGPAELEEFDPLSPPDPDDIPF